MRDYSTERHQVFIYPSQRDMEKSGAGVGFGGQSCSKIAMIFHKYVKSKASIYI